MSFYKQHRKILDGDIIHVRRADGRDYDAILHVDPLGAEKGLLMIYNPLNVPIHRKIRVDLYYTGLKNKAKVTESSGSARTISLNPKGRAWVEFDVPARGQKWLIFK